jgi:hypothetical protein
MIEELGSHVDLLPTMMDLLVFKESNTDVEFFNAQPF